MFSEGDYTLARKEASKAHGHLGIPDTHCAHVGGHGTSVPFALKILKSKKLERGDGICGSPGLYMFRMDMNAAQCNTFSQESMEAEEMWGKVIQCWDNSSQSQYCRGALFCCTFHGIQINGHGTMTIDPGVTSKVKRDGNKTQYASGPRACKVVAVALDYGALEYEVKQIVTGLWQTDS
jgi:hypothetical protein